MPLSPGGVRNPPYKSRKLNRVQGLEALLKLLIWIPGLLKVHHAQEPSKRETVSQALFSLESSTEAGPGGNSTSEAALQFQGRGM